MGELGREAEPGEEECPGARVAGSEDLRLPSLTPVGLGSSFESHLRVHQVQCTVNGSNPPSSVHTGWI